MACAVDAAAIWEMMGATENTEQLQQVFERETPGHRIIGRASSDNLKLFIEVVSKAEGEPVMLTKEQLVAVLRETTDETLVNQGVLDDIVREVQTTGHCEQRRVAKGKEPVPGRDGKIVFLVKKYSPPSKENPVIEFVDYRFAKFFDNIEMGTAVARVYPPAPGSFGVDVFGKPIEPQPGKPFSLKPDDTIKVQSPEPPHRFETLIAKRPGFVVEEAGKVFIKGELVIAENVDFKTGDIDFIGKVVVKKDVTKNFKVSGREGVEIQGNVVAATLRSQLGSVTVKGNVTGLEGSPLELGQNASSGMLVEMIGEKRPKIVCSGEFHAHTASGINVECSGDIVIEKESRDSILRTRGTLRMPKGHLLGGALYTVCGAEVGIIGSAGGGHTTIYLCSDVESSAEYSKLMEQIEQHETAIEATQLYLGPHLKNKSQLNLLAPKHREKIHTLMYKLQQMAKSLEQLQHERQEMLKSARHTISYRVNYLKNLYAGVEVRAGEAVLKVNETLKGPGTLEFDSKEGVFRIRELLPVECILEDQQKKKT